MRRKGSGRSGEAEFCPGLGRAQRREKAGAAEKGKCSRYRKKKRVGIQEKICIGAVRIQEREACMIRKKYDELETRIYDSRREMGEAAAADIAAAVKKVLGEKEECSMIFAAAPSQNEVLEALRGDPSIEWGRIRAFHMDEYCGLAPDAPQTFGNFLERALFARVPLKAVHYLRDAGTEPEEICANYAALLERHPADIVCLGIGENGHIAFNDPPVADFEDPETVKLVELDSVCRRQQVNDGCFPSLEEVPACAVTLTVPALCRAERMFCVVPGARKADAVRNTCQGEIGEKCPATALRRHGGAVLYLDRDSAAGL